MATEISYNDAVIGSLEGGQTATLACAGKKAVGNIVVAFDGAGGITYGGSTTDVEAGKTATLQCAGKKMTSDVYVTVEKADGLIGTWRLNETLSYVSSRKAYKIEGYSGITSGCVFDVLLINKTNEALTCYYKPADGQPYTLLFYYETTGSVGPNNSGPYVRYRPTPQSSYKSVLADETARTIVITGGADVENADLLEYLRVNATKIS